MNPEKLSQKFLRRSQVTGRRKTEKSVTVKSCHRIVTEAVTGLKKLKMKGQKRPCDRVTTVSFLIHENRGSQRMSKKRIMNINARARELSQARGRERRKAGPGRGARALRRKDWSQEGLIRAVRAEIGKGAVA